jgi:xanthine dehydrogenase YagS FAD-binding subunit
MSPFTYTRAATVDQALESLRAGPKSKFLGGGTNLIDLMKMGVEAPAQLVDVNRLPLAAVEELPDGKGVRLGALSRNADVAEHPLIKARYPLLREALLSGASPQLRNLATTGGNLLQRTRCPYFYDPDFSACNKRRPGSGCGALTGFNRMHAILGQSDQCIAVHPSDMCVAMAALEATIQVTGPKGARGIPFSGFHRLPGKSPDQEVNLAPDELIVAVDLPAPSADARSLYLKVRDRASYAFALVSVAAVLEIGPAGQIKSARLALGGVAHKPWRVTAAEEMLKDKPAGKPLFEAAAAAGLAEAKGYKHNTFKIELARRTLVQALSALALPA